MQFVYKYFVKHSEFFVASVNLDNYFTGCKSFCFSTGSNQLLPKLSQRLYLVQTLIKTQKNNYNSIIIVQTLKNRKKRVKINFIHWVASQQALSFYAPS